MNEQHKIAARHAVKNAVRRGDLKRPNYCKKCGCKCIPQAHHRDYKEPLKIFWVCEECHKELHK